MNPRRTMRILGGAFLKNKVVELLIPQSGANPKG